LGTRVGTGRSDRLCPPLSTVNAGGGGLPSPLPVHAGGATPLLVVKRPISAARMAMEAVLARAVPRLGSSAPPPRVPI